MIKTNLRLTPMISVILIFGIGLITTGLGSWSTVSGAGNWGYALQFNGTGANDIDRVKIRIDPNTPIDVGADFTLEWWMKANLQDNGGSVNCGAEAGWITGNIMLDRDVYNAGDYGDYGISLHRGRIAFGVSRGSSGTTLCGTTVVADGVWHHIAVTRANSTGQLAIYVDGVRDALGTGPTGDVSYRNGRATGFPNSDPYLVIGAEKHDAGSQYPSYQGLMDEFRLSNIVRYTANFTRMSSPFTADANTVGLYHFDEGSGTTARDSATVSGAPTNGTIRVGGNPGGPIYVTSGAGQSGTSPTNTPTNTPTKTVTPTPINTPTKTPTPMPTTIHTSTKTATPVPTLIPTSAPTTTAGNWGYALQFGGTGSGDIDRVKIRVDPNTPIDVGADFTLEWWMKANAQDNTGLASCGTETGWSTGNILFDRDVYFAGDNGDYGVALHGGRIAFGVSRGSSGTTLCGTTIVANGNWHHIAVTRASSTGQLAIYVDGVRDALGTGPTGDVSYRNGRSTSFPNTDPYLVIGAEKTDEGSQYPSYRGIMDEIRLSNNIRYASNFTPSGSPFTPDANTVGLYHFNEGSGTTALDSATVTGAPTNGTIRVGGNPVRPVYVTSGAGQLSAPMSMQVAAFSAPADSQEVLIAAVPALQPGYYEETAPEIQYSGLWETYESSGGSVRYTLDANAAMTFTFDGQSLVLYLTRRPDGGSVTACIDQQCQLMDTWAPETRSMQNVSFAGLSAGTHQVEIRNISGVYLDLDALQVFEQPDPQIVVIPALTATSAPTLEPTLVTATAGITETATASVSPQFTVVPATDVVVTSTPAVSETPAETTAPATTESPTMSATETFTAAPTETQMVPAATATSLPSATQTFTPAPTETAVPTQPAEPTVDLTAAP